MARPDRAIILSIVLRLMARSSRAMTEWATEPGRTTVQGPDRLRLTRAAGQPQTTALWPPMGFFRISQFSVGNTPLEFSPGI